MGNFRGGMNELMRQAARLQRKVGTTQRVLIDHADAKAVVARSSADAPEIDGVVHLAPSPKLVAGEFAHVRITRADEHDLWGVAV